MVCPTTSFNWNYQTTATKQEKGIKNNQGLLKYDKINNEL